jgi:hypothetical protein
LPLYRTIEEKNNTDLYKLRERALDKLTLEEQEALGLIKYTEDGVQKPIDLSKI